MKKAISILIFSCVLLSFSNVEMMAQTPSRRVVKHSNRVGQRTNSDNYVQENIAIGIYDLTSRRLTSADMYGKSYKDLEILRNMIYAIHGYIFKRNDLYNFFSQYSWYHPNTRDMNVAYSRMSDIEKYNIAFIKRYEQ